MTEPPYGPIVIGEGDDAVTIPLEVEIDWDKVHPHGWIGPDGTYHRLRSAPMIPDEIAQVCHEANRRLQQILGDPISPPWEECSMHIRASAVDGVVNAIENDITPQESHENWVEFKVQDGWVHGPEKDEQKKTHPLLIPYEELPAEQKAKDSLFLAIVNALRDPGPVAV